MELTPSPVTKPSRPQPVAGLLLAAGASKRAGHINKLFYVNSRLKPHTSLVATSAQALLDSSIDDAIVITGDAHHQLSQLLQPLGLELIYNSAANRGMGTSLSAGILRLQSAGAILVCLADMPDIKYATYEAILACWRGSGHDKFIVPTFEGERGNPVVIPNRFYSRFFQLDGDFGARHVIEQHPEHVITCEVNDSAILRDYDSHDQLQQAGWVVPSTPI